MDMHEFLKFNKPASKEAVMDNIMSHYEALIEVMETTEADSDGEWQVEIVIDGNPAHNAGDLVEMRKVLSMLPDADSFSIDVMAMDLKEEAELCLYSFLDEIKTVEDFTYKYASFSEKFAEFEGKYIANGKSGDFLDNEMEGVFSDEEMLWYSWGCSLYAKFDFDEQIAVTEKLQELVRKYLPEDQIEVAEAEWCGAEPDVGAFIPDLQWVVSDLKEIKEFSDEVNDTLKALDGNYEIKVEGIWFDLEHFAAAEWRVFDKHVKLVCMTPQC